MILINQIITDIRIESVNDLYKLKPFLEDGTLKINKSQIARELEVDRRTVDKYINGYTKPETRNCDDCITPFYDTITELLSDKNQQVFYYRKVLWQYLVDNHGFKGVYCNFCHYLRNILNSIHISEKADHQIPIRLLSDMKLLWVNRLSLIGKNLFRLFFLQVKL